MHRESDEFIGEAILELLHYYVGLRAISAPQAGILFEQHTFTRNPGAGEDIEIFRLFGIEIIGAVDAVGRN